MALSLLDHAVYSYADVDRLVGLQPGTALRWLEGYTRQGRFYEPVLREERSGSDVVTWGEMVEARLLAEARIRSDADMASGLTVGGALWAVGRYHGDTIMRWP